MEFISVARNNQTQDINYDSSTGTVIIKLANDGNKLKAGTTGSLQINVRIPNGSAVDGTTFKNKATIEATGVTPVISNEVSVNTYGSKSFWKTTKTQILPLVNPAPGSEVTYSVGLMEDNTNPYGHINLKNVVLNDVLPQGSEFVYAEDGSYDSATNTVTWNLGNLNVGDKIAKKIIIKYPDGIFVQGNTAINKANATGKDSSGNNIIIPESSVATTFAIPASPDPGSIGFQKSTQFSYRNIGQDQNFYITNIKNPSNKSLDNFVVKDDSLPSQLDYTKIYLPQPNVVHDYTFLYKTHKNDWMVYTVTDSDKNNNFISVSNLLQDASDWITGIEFDFKTVPPGFDAGTITIAGKVINPDKDGTNVLHGNTISNTATLSYNDGTNVNLSSKALFSINKSKPWINITKTHNESKYYIPGDTVEFNLNIENEERGTGNYKNPVIYDLLPLKFDYVENSWDFSGANIPNVQPEFTKIENFNGTGRTLLKWFWTSSNNYEIPIGQNIQIKYQSKIEPFTPATITGTREYNNDSYITTNEEPDVGFWWDDINNDWDSNKNTIKDSNNFDGDSSKEQYLVKSSRSVYINNVASVITTKWNKGQLDSNYSKFPAYGNTLPGGTADYKLEIYNDGNNWLKRIQILDILPYIGDTAILTSQARKSQWRPNLIQQLPQGDLTLNGIPVHLDVYYSSTNDKTYANFNYNKNDTNYWIKNNLPINYDITGIKSIYFDITNINDGKGLEPGKTVTLEWKMRAPVSAPTGIVAWNSVGAKLTTAEGTDLNPTEPMKVGFKVGNSTLQKCEIGDFVWFDSNKDGIQNDGYDNQKAGINNIIAKLYKSDGTFVDETLTANDHNGVPGYYLFPNLDPGDYYVQFEVPDYYKATIEKQGTDESKDSNGQELSSGGGKRIIKTDNINAKEGDKNYSIDLGLIPANDYASMTVDKKALSVIGKSIDLNADPTKPVNKGEGILYGVEVKNTGTVPLYNIKVQDFMDNNQSGFAFTQAGFNTSSLLPINSNIHLSSFNAGSGNPYLVLDKLDVGQTLYLRGQYTVKNTDVNGTSLDNTINVWSNETNSDNTKDIPLTDATSVNISDMTITKTSNINVVEPGVDGKDTINYTITVKNNGNVPLNNVVVIDTKIDTFTNLDANLIYISPGKVNIGTLNVGQSIPITGTYKVPISSLPNKVTNKATATNPDIRYTVSASKDVATKSLAVTKIATDSDKIVSVGDTIIYNITVTNKGSASLNNVQIINDTLTSTKGTQDLTGSIIGTIPSPIPAGQSGTVQVKYTVTEADIDDIDDNSTAKIINTVKVKSSDTTPERQATETLDIADVKVVKTETSTGPYKAGDEIKYKITVTNHGTIDLFNLSVNDLLYNKDKGNDFTQIDNYTISSLKKGETDTKDITYKLTEEDISSLDSNDLKNKAVVHINPTGDEKYSDVNVRTKGITLEKIGVKDSIGTILTEGSIINYTFKVKNIGSSTLNNVTIKDDKLSYNENIGTLAPGQEIIKNYAYTVKSSDLPGSIINNAIVTSDEGVTASATNRVGDSDIKVVKNVIKGHGQEDYIKSNYSGILNQDLVKVYKDDPVTYVFTVTNTGDTYLKDITLNDTILNINETSMKLIPEISDIYNFDSSTKLSTGQKLVFYYEAIANSDLINTVSATAISINKDGTEIQNVDKPSSKDTAEIKLLAKIGDTVWLDKNSNGVQDSDEKGIQNVKVDLEDAAGNIVKSTLTDDNGKYLFEDIESGSYTIIVEKPAGINQTYDPDSSKDDETNVTISGGQSIMTADFGYIYTGSLKGTLWYDLSEGGNIDSDEQRITGVTILLKDSNGNIIDQATTDSNGDYVFNNLPGGIYTVEVMQDSLPQGIYIVYDLDRAFGNDESWIKDHLTQINLAPGENREKINFGYQYTGSIGDTVWYDLNSNGLLDGNENGVNGVKVELYKAGQKIAEKVTDLDGKYIFTGLEKGEYTIKVVTSPILDGYVETYDLDGTLGNETKVYLAPKQDITNVDFGYAPIPHMTIKKTADRASAMVGDTINYTITIKNDGTKALTNVILTDSMISVNEIIPNLSVGEVKTFIGSYLTKNSDLPGPLVNNAEVFSNETSKVQDSASVEITPKPVPPPEVKLASLGDLVFKDSNKNGIQDAGEIGIKGVNVNLYNLKDELISGTITDENGLYKFTNLTPGSYYVKFLLPEGYKTSPKNAGTDIQKDSDPDEITGKTDIIILNSGDNNLTYDAGIYKEETGTPIDPGTPEVKLASLGDLVFKDSNKNGIQDAGEIGLKGVNINLYNSKDELISTTRTEEGGLYKFTNLTPGSYYVKFLVPEGYKTSPKNAGTDIQKDSDADEITDKTGIIILNSGDNNLTYDAGIYKEETGTPIDPGTPEDEENYDDEGNLIGGNPGTPEVKLASLGDLVFKDSNKNGIQDAGEIGIKGVNVNLYNSKDELISGTITDENGLYKFTNLTPGSYYVKFLLPEGYKTSPKNVETDIQKDSDADEITGKTDIIILNSGDNNLTYDAGIYKEETGTVTPDEPEETNNSGGNNIGGTPKTETNTMPKTATPYYNLIFIGMMMFILGTTLWILDRKKKKYN